MVEPWKAADYYINTFGWGTNFDNGAVTKVSWVMLREISLAYQFKPDLVNKIHVKGASIRLSVRNIGYLYNGLTGGQNPASIQSNNPFDPFITGAVPFSRNYSASVNVNF